MYEYVQDSDGNRKNTRVTEGYFRLLGDFILDQVQDNYGRGSPIQ